MASGGDVTLGATTGTFTVSLSVMPTAPGTLVNPASNGICRVDPSAMVAESDEVNNDCTDTVAVTQPNLHISKANDVEGTAAVQSEITWTWTITNAGHRAGHIPRRQGPAAGQPAAHRRCLRRSDQERALSNRITCTVAGDDLVCTANSTGVTIAAGGRFDVKVTFSPNVPGTLSSPRQNGSCTFDPDGVVAESNETDNNCSDVITILGPAHGHQDQQRQRHVDGRQLVDVDLDRQEHRSLQGVVRKHPDDADSTSFRLAGSPTVSRRSAIPSTSAAPAR